MSKPKVIVELDLDEMTQAMIRHLDDNVRAEYDKQLTDWEIRFFHGPSQFGEKYWVEATALVEPKSEDK